MICPNLTILVAEDEFADRILLERAFVKARSEAVVEYAEDGEQVIDLLSRCTDSEARPDLLLLDLKMPRVTGFEVLEWFAQKPEFRPERVVVFSSSNHHADVERARQLGADHFLVKPTNPADMVVIVQKLENLCLSHKAGQEHAAGEAALPLISEPCAAP